MLQQLVLFCEFEGNNGSRVLAQRKLGTPLQRPSARARDNLCQLRNSLRKAGVACQWLRIADAFGRSERFPGVRPMLALLVGSASIANPTNTAGEPNGSPRHPPQRTHSSRQR